MVISMTSNNTKLRCFLIKVARWLIRLAMDGELRRDLDRVYERLDDDMPNMLLELKPTQMTGTIASAIADVTGHKATADRIDAVVALYNPIAATIRNFR